MAMIRGRRPPIGNAFVWAFTAGVVGTIGIEQCSAGWIACAIGYLVIGPIAWFAGRP